MKEFTEEGKLKPMNELRQSIDKKSLDKEAVEELRKSLEKVGESTAR